MEYFKGGANKRSWEFGYVEVSDWLILEKVFLSQEKV